MYKVGDKVSYSPKNHKATIIRVLPGDEYTIEFEDTQLIPPQMKVPGEYLSRPSSETNCPRCGKEWTETVIGRNTFYDCIPCKLKKEDA
jgi:predicted  nucleic acid-binding Zn ribbon protein